MDDFEFDIQNHQKDARRKVKLVKNGDPSWMAGCMVKDHLRFDALAEIICDTLEISRREAGNVRVFKTGGVEVFDEDVQYIKDGDILFVSQGDDFDESSNFAAFKLLQCLGQGGYGKVYEAKNRLTKEKFAIKMIDCSKIKNAKDTEMIYKELIALKNLTHRCIVKVYNCFTLQKELKVALVLEYLEGGDLRDYINEKKVLEEKEAQKIFSQLFSAVQYCHKENIIHRDLKLENIMFEDKEHEKVKVVDFGISGRQSLVNIDFTEAGSIRYLAPEVITTHAPAHPSIDVWAMGCILFWMLTGNSPFPQSTREAVQDSIVKGKWSISTDDKKKLSKAAQSLIKHILIVNPKHRPTMGEIAEHKWMTMTVDDIYEEEEEREAQIQLQSKKEKNTTTDSPLINQLDTDSREGSPFVINSSNKLKGVANANGSSIFKPPGNQVNGSTNFTGAPKNLGSSMNSLVSGSARKSLPNQPQTTRGGPTKSTNINSLLNTPDQKPDNRLILPKIEGAQRRFSCQAHSQLISASGLSPKNSGSSSNTLIPASTKKESLFKQQAIRANSPPAFHKVPHSQQQAHRSNKLNASFNDLNIIQNFSSLNQNNNKARLSAVRQQQID